LPPSLPWIDRYGGNLTFGLVSKHRWKLLVPCALSEAIGHVFYPSVYLVTSNAGELMLLFGVTSLLNLVQDELGLASSFADYLHRSNIAFTRAHAELLEAQAKEASAGLTGHDYDRHSPEHGGSSSAHKGGAHHSHHRHHSIESTTSKESSSNGNKASVVANLDAELERSDTKNNGNKTAKQQQQPLDGDLEQGGVSAAVEDTKASEDAQAQAAVLAAQLAGDNNASNSSNNSSSSSATDAAAANPDDVQIELVDRDQDRPPPQGQ
jgi:hypothetical protein